MTTPMKCMIAIVLAFVAFTCVGNPATQPVQEQKALVEFSGAHSKIAQRAYLRITSLKEFRDAYMRHLGIDPSRFDEYYNENNVPTIDFDRCMVIAVFDGDGWNTAGISVEAIRDEADRVLVRFAHRFYQTSGDFNSGDGGGKRVTAFGMFVIPRSEKEVVLEEGQQQMRPPRIYAWKEVARFPAIK